MSSDEAADDAQDPERVRFIVMRAEDTFDGQERVFSRAAYDLHILAAAHSASCGHPGFVPTTTSSTRTASHGRPHIETTITAAELCALGTWERVDAFGVEDLRQLVQIVGLPGLAWRL
jgi:hypothetical protein